MSKRSAVHIGGRLWLNKGEKPFLGKGRIELLEGIQKHGSISQAARAMGMSYKAAWDLIDAMNNLSDKPLVVRKTGGKSGGGTQVTPTGLRFIEMYNAVEREHGKFLQAMSTGVTGFDQFYPLLQRFSMKTSARNHFYGTVSAIKKGDVNAEVTLALPGDTSIVATITIESLQALGLKRGAEAFALIKAPWVIITTDLKGVKLSARNRLCGTVLKLVKGGINTDVTIELAGGTTVSAVITNTSAQEMKLKKGAKACAIFKASSVILGVSA